MLFGIPDHRVQKNLKDAVAVTAALFHQRLAFFYALFFKARVNSSVLERSRALSTERSAVPSRPPSGLVHVRLPLSVAIIA